MVRPIYYQNVGNPLQRDRLPRTRPRQEWPSESPPHVARRVTQGAITLLFIASGGGVLAGIIFAALVPVFLLIVPAALLGISLCYQFCKHYAYRSTVAPLDRPTAEVLRRRFTRSGLIFCPLFLLGLLPFLLTPMAHPGHLLVPKLSVLPLYVAAAISLLICAGTPATAARAFREAVTSWCAYNRREIDTPGVFQSPVGSAGARVGLLALAGLTTGLLLGASALKAWQIRQSGDFLPELAVSTSPLPVIDYLLRHALEAAITAVAAGGLVIALLFLCAVPVVTECFELQRHLARTTTWDQQASTLERSSDAIERDSYPLGFNDDDGSPLLVPLGIYDEHAWILGDTGAGKTSKGLAPFVEWLAARGRHSVVVIDLKGDDLALFEALRRGTEAGRRRSGRDIPFRYFTNELGQATYGFNPLNQSNRSRLSRYQLTHLICVAMNAIHGVHYGERWFGLAGLTTVYETLKQFRDIRSCRDLAKRLDYMVVNAKREVLHNEIRKAGLEPQLVLRQLAAMEALNVTPETHPGAVSDHAIDFSAERSPFTEPQSHYFYLSTALGPGGAGEIARLVAHTLITAAKTTRRNRRRTRVYLVIDEWPEMLSSNLAYVLRQARSFGVSVILANQSMQDVRSPKMDLLPVLTSNCRLRQWFAVSSPDDQRLLAELSGLTVEHIRGQNIQQGPNGTTYGESLTESVMPRLSINDIRLASDDRDKSIVQITSGRGYAQFGVLPFVVQSPFHISQREFESRRDAEWPEGDAGTFPARDDDDEPVEMVDLPDAPSSPVIDTETIERPRRRSRRDRDTN